MAKSNKVPLSADDKKRKALLTPCKTRDQLNNWIKYHLGLNLPDCTVSRYADTNPLDIIWEVYRICVLRQNPENIKEILCVAGRGSGKCSVKGTKILTNAGLKSIEDVQVGDTVYTGWNWDTVKATFDEGIKDSVRVRTSLLSKETPFTMTGSMKHRVQAVKEDGTVGWVHMPDLQVGQYIYKSAHCSFDIDTYSDKYMDGWLVGAIVGDGTINRHQSNQVVMCNSDFDMLRFYAKQVHKRFNVSHKVKRNSKKSVNLSIYSADLKKWLYSHIEGSLSYDKKLKTLDHSPNFLAGFISGLMETDGYREGITLANKELIYQVGQILNSFGVAVAINNSRRRPAPSKFKSGLVTYHECTFKTKLHDFLMPMFSKRQPFIRFKESMNEQFRYPNVLLKPFAKVIKEKLGAENGYITANGIKRRLAVPYAKELYGNLSKVNKHVYGYKIKAIREFFASLGMKEEVGQLHFILDGYFETVSDKQFAQDYFYDLEISDVHSYWSNGFVSHNTLGMAIAELLVILHDKREVAHVGAILSQAKRCYEYQMKFLLNDKIRPIVDSPKVAADQKILQKANMEKSYFLIDGEQVTLEVLPCTLKSVNGPHVPLVVVDEIDTVSGEGLKAFKDINGMLDSKNGKQSLRVGISTRKSRYGLMNQQIENAEKEGRTVRKWTAFEFTERCEDKRSGLDPMDLYVNQDAMEVLTQEEYDKKDVKKQKEFVKSNFPGKGCSTCPIAAICLGDAKKQTSTSPMLKPLEDLIKKVKSEGADWALAQLMNLKPSVEGIVYKEFEEKIHVKTWNEMWFLLTSKEFPGECSHDMFVKKCHEMKLQCYGGIDWGWSNPNTVVYFFADRKDNIYVVRCDGMTYVSQPSWVHHIKTKWHHMYRCQLYFPDVADQGAIDEMRKAGLPTANNVDKAINTGVQAIKKMLKVPGQTEPKIFFAKETCGPIITEFQLYHFKTDAAGLITDSPEEEYDHWLDALRYPITMLYGKQTLVMAGSGSSLVDHADVVQNDGSFKRVPTAAEYATANHMRFNSEVDTSKLGKIGTAGEIDKDDEDGMSGDGGFLFSF